MTKFTFLLFTALSSSYSFAQGNWPDLPAPYVNGVGKFDLAVNYVPQAGGGLQQLLLKNMLKPTDTSGFCNSVDIRYVLQQIGGEGAASTLKRCQFDGNKGSISALINNKVIAVRFVYSPAKINQKTSATNSKAPCVARPLSEARKQAVAASFKVLKPVLQAYTNPTGFGPMRLFDLQAQSAPTLRWAVQHNQRDMVEQLAQIYDQGYSQLQTVSSYKFRFVCDSQGRCPRETELPIQPTKMWRDAKGVEQLLYSTQFLYPVSRVISYTAQLAPEERGTILPAFVARWLPIVLHEHYQRWVFGRPGEPGNFDRAGWGCGYGNFNHVQLWQNLDQRLYGTSAFKGVNSKPTGWCNGFQHDTDWWITTGVAELLMAHRAAPDLVNMDESLFRQFDDYVQLVLKVSSQRVTSTVLHDTTGKLVTGQLFDRGEWDAHPDNNYAGDTAPTYPGWAVKGQLSVRAPKPGKGVGWDIPHSRREIMVLDSFRRATTVLGNTWPSQADMQAFARQFAYAVVRKDEQGKTKFTNFMDGTNGWYRVNYSDRPNFGYAPFALSEQAVGAGYGFWGAYEPEALTAVQRYVSETGTSSFISMVGEPSLEALDSEPNSCTPGYTHVSRPSLDNVFKANQDEGGLSGFRPMR